jgi:tetratricopeptide (TPR) repeat protein
LEEEMTAYVNGLADSQLVRKVENHLLDCPLCSDAVEGLESNRAASRAFQSLEDFSSFKKKLPGANREAKMYQLVPRRAMLSAAASIALLVAAYFAFFSTPSPDSLYTQFYTPYENDIPVATRNAAMSVNSNSPFYSGLDRYDHRNFIESIPYFEQALQEQPDSEAAHFFAGMAYLETAQWDKAVTHFDKAVFLRGNYANQATWFMALTYLKKGEKGKAIEMLDVLIAKGGFKEEQAITLRKKLK